MSSNKLTHILLWVSRILFGIVFIFSGFVKAIDPLGSVYKFQDYFLAFNLEALFPLALPMAILLSSLEFTIGVVILLGINMRYNAWAGLFFMVFFTPLTLYIALYNPVSDCGCFGDALIISNWATFNKNVVILAASIFIFYHRKSFSPLWSIKKDWLLTLLVMLVSIALSVYCLRNLPIIDFRPWKVGNNINEKVLPVAEISDVYLVYRNKQTGELKDYPINNYPWNDPEWLAAWEFVDQKRIIIQDYQEAPITNFSIQDEFGDDYTESYMRNPDYVFMVVAYDLNRTRRRAFERKINALAESAEEEGISLIVLTGSSFQNIDRFRHDVQAAYPFYQTDEVALKTIVRANPGLLLMKDGVVEAKWHWRNIPAYNKIKQRHMESQ